MQLQFDSGTGFNREAIAVYERRPSAHRSALRDEILEVRRYGDVFQDAGYLSNLFHLAREYEETSLAAPIFDLLASSHGNWERYREFHGEGIAALQDLDRGQCLATCQDLLGGERPPAAETEARDPGEEKRVSLALLTLIRAGAREDYERFITVENVRMLERSWGPLLDPDDLDLESFGIDPSAIDDPGAEDR
jgi:hypothetical protein